MKKNRRFIAFALTFCLVFTMAVPSFAAGDRTEYDPQPSKVYDGSPTPNGDFNYLSLGDSMTNGYGLPGYMHYEGGADMNPASHEGFRFAVENAYPDLLAKKINSNYGYRVNLYQYAFTATRLEDVMALISTDDAADPNYYPGDAYTDHYIIEERIDRLYGPEAGNTPMEKFGFARTDFQAAVKKANLISVCLGMNTFVCLFRDRVNAWSDGAFGEDTVGLYDENGDFIYKLDTVLSPEAAALFDRLNDALNKVLTSQLGENAGNLPEKLSCYLNDQIYALASLGDAYKKLCNRIYELNPDAKVLLMGFPYGVKDTYVTVDIPGGNGMTVDLDIGSAINALFGVIDAYIGVRAHKYEGKAAYVEYGDVDLIFQEIAKLESGGKVDVDAAYEEIVFDGATTDFFYDAAQKIVNKIGTVEGQTQTLFNKDSVRKGVDYVQGDSTQNADCALVGEVFLGFRDAIVDVLGYDEENPYNHINIDNMVSYMLNTEGRPNFDTLLSGDNLAALQEAAAKVTNDGEGGAKDQSLRAEVARLLKSEGAEAFVFFHARTLMGNGYSSHTSLKGHQDEADRLFAAFRMLQKQDVNVKDKIKKVVPVIVGGVVVTFVTVAVAKVIKNKIKNGQVADDPGLQSGFMSAVEKLRTFFNGIFSKLSIGNIFSFNFE